MQPHLTNELERDIQARILKYLRSRLDSFTVKLAAGPYSTPGIPDILHVEDGHTFFFEVKRVGGKVTPLQRQTLDQIMIAGVTAAVVYDLQTVKVYLEREGLKV